MKNKGFILTTAIAFLGVSGALFAAQQTGKKAQVVLTPVTVAVQGFHCQACPDRLQPDLAKIAGASEVKATLKPAQVTAKLDESKITASEFVAAIASHKQAMDAKKTYGAGLVVYVDTAMCAAQKKMCDACFTEIPKALKTVKGVADVKLDETGKIATITFAPGAKVKTADLAAALAKSSFKFTSRFAEAETGTQTADAAGECPYAGSAAMADEQCAHDKTATTAAGDCDHDAGGDMACCNK